MLPSDPCSQSLCSSSASWLIRSMTSLSSTVLTPSHATVPPHPIFRSPLLLTHCVHVMRRRRGAALQRQARVLPVDEPTCVPPDIRVAPIYKRSVDGHARQAVHVRAVHHDLIVLPQCGIEIIGLIEMEGPRDVLGVEGPTVERHDELDRLSPIELALQVFAADRSDRLRSERGEGTRLVTHVYRASSRDADFSTFFKATAPSLRGSGVLANGPLAPP